jgi:hypothetical protein
VNDIKSLSLQKLEVATVVGFFAVPSPSLMLLLIMVVIVHVVVVVQE